MPAYAITNTVNTALNREYDFGVHADGCQDVTRAERAGCTVDRIDAADTTAARAWIIDDMEDGGFDRESAEAFEVRIFPCCGR